jgi:hypothetical protein
MSSLPPAVNLLARPAIRNCEAAPAWTYPPQCVPCRIIVGLWTLACGGRPYNELQTRSVRPDRLRHLLAQGMLATYVQHYLYKRAVADIAHASRKRGTQCALERGYKGRSRCLSAMQIPVVASETSGCAIIVCITKHRRGCTEQIHRHQASSLSC